MFLRTWSIMRRGWQQGASLRDQHTILGEQPLSSRQLLREAKDAALDDAFFTPSWVHDYHSAFIQGFHWGYTQAERQSRLSLLIVTIKDAIYLDYLSTHCECKARLKKQEERDIGYCSKCWPAVANAIGEQRRRDQLNEV